MGENSITTRMMLWMNNNKNVLLEIISAARQWNNGS